MKKIVLITLILVITLTLPFCKNNRHMPANSTKKVDQSLLPQYSARYSPLTYDKFLSIRNNQDAISTMDINYSTIKDPDQYGVFQDLEDLLLQTQGTHSLTLNLFPIYLGSYDHRVDNANPPVDLFLEKEFTPAELDVLYNYLNANHEYFFNEQFDTFDSEYVHMCEAQYMFTIAFFEPTDSYNTPYNAWAFSKCSDNPDQIFQGLIDILEDNFITQFE